MGKMSRDKGKRGELKAVSLMTILQAIDAGIDIRADLAPNIEKAIEYGFAERVEVLQLTEKGERVICDHTYHGNWDD